MCAMLSLGTAGQGSRSACTWAQANTCWEGDMPICPSPACTCPCPLHGHAAWMPSYRDHCCHLKACTGAGWGLHPFQHHQLGFFALILQLSLVFSIFVFTLLTPAGAPVDCCSGLQSFIISSHILSSFNSHLSLSFICCYLLQEPGPHLHGHGVHGPRPQEPHGGQGHVLTPLQVGLTDGRILGSWTPGYPEPEMVMDDLQMLVELVSGRQGIVQS